MKIPGLRKKSDSGQQAEIFTAAFLRRQGLEIVERNYRCRWGEIDIIARQEDLLIFTEVRLRNNHAFASGAESVNYHKRQRLTATANHYLQHHYGDNPPPCRFDVVSLGTNADNKSQYNVTWVEDAFRP